jgi:hypothetical protein
VARGLLAFAFRLLLAIGIVCTLPFVRLCRLLRGAQAV